jgi:hypothetical protein
MQNVSSQSRLLQNCPAAANHAQMSDPHQAKIEKRYIDPNNVRFEQKEMYVQLDQNWVITNAVYTDADGFYILETKGGWTCGYCGNYNEGSYWVCERCGRRRD